ncbi:DUF368 domain-containing protein [Taurinivorans muris]|uniref:DUF368 domain-containing protein n=1 Tax=Taurinivorans muris TaxID=2787751 RepID=A0ABY5Y2V4_9BACT|nr:DUF368 domain-containing protein [Desulfovibrionaceae bacterium LT0009]
MNALIRYFLCGFLMGIADTIPGVSGGTIAFITGIYGKLLDTIKSVDKEFFKLLFTLQIKKAFMKIPWSFALPLLLGIGSAVFLFARIMVALLETYADIVWAFFFGLILSSLFILLAEIKKKNPHKLISVLCFFAGGLFALWLGFATPLSLETSYPVVFFSGFIAICAMILPGISGAFILVLIGQYHNILHAVTTLDFPVILLFLLGCVCGIFSFAHVLGACLNKFYHATLSFLSGILAGSLVTLFPFQSNQDFSYALLLLALVFAGFIIPITIHILGKKHS